MSRFRGTGSVLPRMGRGLCNAQDDESVRPARKKGEIGLVSTMTGGETGLLSGKSQQERSFFRRQS